MQSGYFKLAFAITLNGIAMYFITYALIDTTDHFYFNINRLYMTIMMVSPMMVVMLVVMRRMFPLQAVNYVLIAAFSCIFGLFFAFGRVQAAVGNEQFLRSMIPHHSSAILMCENPSLDDQEIIELCYWIIKTQKEEIVEMERILERYRKSL